MSPISLSMTVSVLLMATTSFTVSGAVRNLTFVESPYENPLSRWYTLLDAPYSVTSPIECGVLCVDNPVCSNFLYNSSLQECLLFGAANSTVPTYTFNQAGQWQSFVAERSLRCPSPSTYARPVDKCWWIQNMNVDWLTAGARCNSLSGHLVEFSSLEVQHFLQGVIRSHSSLTEIPGYWVGAARDPNLGFIWMTGPPQTVDPAMWGPGQPDSNEGCADLYRSVNAALNYDLNDVSCNEIDAIRGTICDIPI